MMKEKIYYVKGSEINEHEGINMSLADGWTVKSITPENVHTSSAGGGEAFSMEHKTIRSNFVIVLEQK